MRDIRYPRYPVEIVNDVPVITVPEEIVLTTADEFRIALLEATTHGHATVVVDMTHTRFCDSAGLKVLAGAHRRALAGGGELRLVIPTDSPVLRVFTITRLDRFIPRFDSLTEALLRRPEAVILPLKPRRPPGLPRLPRPASSPDAGA